MPGGRLRTYPKNKETTFFIFEKRSFLNIKKVALPTFRRGFKAKSGFFFETRFLLEGGDGGN
jgi:hypothetical protein